MNPNRIGRGGFFNQLPGGGGRGGADTFHQQQNNSQPQQQSSGDVQPSQNTQQWTTPQQSTGGPLPSPQSHGGVVTFHQPPQQSTFSQPQQQSSGDVQPSQNTQSRGGGFKQSTSGGRQSQSGDGVEDVRRSMSAVNLGGDSQQQEPKPMSSKHVPSARTVEQLYKEDDQQAGLYSHIAEEDADVEIQGRDGPAVIIERWEDANFDPRLLKNVINCHYVRPRKIQSYAIPVIMQGLDVKGQSETGTGKTAAFLLPIIDKLIKMDRTERVALEHPSPYALIVEPTRELCLQVYEQGKKFINGIDGVSIAKAYGQYNMRDNQREIEAGCDILCATTGRLKQFVLSGKIKLDKLKFLVLDEADALLDGDFLADIRTLIQHADMPKPEKRQTLLFSATFPEFVEKLSSEALRPAPNSVVMTTKKLVAANTRVVQRVIPVERRGKKEKLLELLKGYIQEVKTAMPNAPAPRVLVFVSAKRDAETIAIYLNENEITSVTVNADRKQELREQALMALRENRASVMVATDVMARGIDIKELDHVINYDLPDDGVTYVHRIGRTGRLGPGLATSFFDGQQDSALASTLVDLVRGAGQVAPEFLVNFAKKNDSTIYGDGGDVNAAGPTQDGWKMETDQNGWAAGY